MPEKNISVQDVKGMNYVQFISLLRETNRCPGGKHTIRKILQNSFIERNSLVLDVGCNTGFTSLEIARIRKCKVIGVDVITEVIEAANLHLSMDTREIQELVSFQLSSALNLKFADNYFDLVVTGGATGFIEDKQRAIREYYRVLKPWGILSVTTLCYMSPPPDRIVQDVSNVLGVKIHPWGPDHWLDLFSQQQDKFEIYSIEKYRMIAREEEAINDYIDYFMEKKHLSIYSKGVRCAIRERWKQTISIFNQNHKYLGFILVLFRKAHIEEEPELFSDFEPVE